MKSRRKKPVPKNSLYRKFVISPRRGDAYSDRWIDKREKENKSLDFNGWI